ncbi:creatininase family protein [Sulfitobacter guttiformis]|uniref:Creatinine amidohydrolase n=1 Tax=Sulfitobacter guttiformis TaxID=74349 RepID=A0A420DTL7_9RHOB|nr:creatininase family protein [Sulfitobacter guttiformis]KIN71029.1 Creatininase subfamily [Sulfitobacter guttiformis KCTC 32187]RKE97513.1 creatinine amidohydrolase [Sulfitobacter guttiformis]
MNVAQMNWRDIEAAAARDPRCILPIGSTEQHAQLSVCVDLILAERVATEAASPLNVPVFPVMPYGLAPYFKDFPGTISLRVETLMAVVRDIIASLRQAGFTQILIVNGHGGNNPVGALAQELMAEYGDVSIKFHNWWNAPLTWAKIQSIDTTGSHANWMENFPWTRLAHAPAPEGEKPMVDMAMMKACPPAQTRVLLKDGSFGGPWQRPDTEMQAIWEVGVAETRAALEGPWAEFGND